MAKTPRKRVPKESRTPRRASAKSLPRAEAQGRQERALADVAGVLKAIEAPAAVIGGIAVIAWGHPRFTADIDCAVAAPIASLNELLGAFEQAGVVPREPDAISFARENLVLLLRHRETGIAVDVSLAQLDFEQQALSHSINRRFGALQIPVPPITDLLIYKLIAGRPKDHEDVSALLSVARGIDAERIDATLAEFDELLDTDRRADWARLSKRSR
jgi:Nucleotidyl transferase AbiEii toxin, Type IV TA system